MTATDTQLTTEQVAGLFGVDVHTVSEWVRTGRLPCTQTPTRRNRRFLRSQVQALLEGRDPKPVTPPAEGTKVRLPGGVPSLDAWHAWMCLSCRSRYFTPGDCCGLATFPVTVAVFRRAL